MCELVLTPRFERAFRRLIGKNPALHPHIETALRCMVLDVNDPRLKTHHLSGQLKGLHASSVGYDCRIVFARQSIRKPVRKFCCLSILGRTKKCTKALAQKLLACPGFFLQAFPAQA